MLNACSQYSGYCLKHTITETLSIQAKFPQALSSDINFFTTVDTLEVLLMQAWL